MSHIFWLEIDERKKQISLQVFGWKSQLERQSTKNGSSKFFSFRSGYFNSFFVLEYGFYFCEKLFVLR